MVPALGLGTWRIGESARTRAAEVAAVRRALELGYRLLDTAEMYGDGGAEAVVGQALAEALAAGDVRREDVFVVSKVLPGNASERGVAAAPLAATVAGFERLRAAGRIRHWGVSNFDVDDLEELQRVPAAAACAANQVYYSASRRGIEFDLLPWQRERRLATMAYCPIDQGTLAAHAALTRLARQLGATAAELALAWVLRHDDVIAIPRRPCGDRPTVSAAASQAAAGDDVMSALSHPSETSSVEVSLNKDRRTARPPFSALTLALVLASAAAVALPLAAAEARRIDASAEALADAMTHSRSVLLGEVHDNAQQHALRLAALKQLIVSGARPVLAFEQFDRERQDDIDRLRRERPGDADALIALGLPIVAANLSRADAMKVSMSGWSAVFDPATQERLGLDRLPPAFVAAHEQAVARGHCDLLPASALPAMARAQIARDIVLAQSVQPHLARGVVLLAGNGHVRNDIGVPVWLAAERSQFLSIALLESGIARDEAAPFDVVVETVPAVRPDPCEALRRRLKPSSP